LLLKTKLNYAKYLIITLVLEKNANFFTENCQKSQKIVIITSVPGLGASVGGLIAELFPHTCHEHEEQSDTDNSNHRLQCLENPLELLHSCALEGYANSSTDNSSIAT
jgi:hypothetical protein